MPTQAQQWQVQQAEDIIKQARDDRKSIEFEMQDMRKECRTDVQRTKESSDIEIQVRTWGWVSLGMGVIEIINEL